jgi:prepilin-type N-terminal cleavage/methylation domain-containing protein
MEQLMRSGARREKGRARRGFSLLEVVIVLGLLGVGLLALAAMQLQALRGGRSGQVDTYATSLAQDRMERLQRLRWTALAPTTGWSAATTRTHPVSGQDYELSWRISDVVPSWTRAIDVRVTWDAPDRPNRSRVLSSLRYNREAL